MTMVLPLGWQVVDANGNPYSGAKAQFYATGTSTPQATYSNAALSSLNANPLVADAAGRFGPAYGPTTTDYKVVLMTSADAIIATFDPVQMTGAVSALSVLTATIANDAVTNPKLANMASPSIKGRKTAATGDPEDLTAAQAASIVGGRILLATLTASASAALDFTLVDSTLYAGYECVFENILPATDNVSFEWLASIDGGTSFITTGTYANASCLTNANPPVGGGSITSAAPAIAQNLGNAAGRGLKGRMVVTSGGSVAYGTQFHSKTGHINNGGGAHLTDAYGANSTATAVNAFRFRMSSGNIASGVIRVNGIVK